MPPELIPEDEDYASSEDSDFAPDTAPAKDDDGTSNEESDAEPVAAKTAAPKKRKRAGDHDAEDLGFENSGDEAIIGHAKKKRAKKAKKGELDEDEGGEGGFVKTRTMRAAEKVERKPLANTAATTIDVDAVWQAMVSGKPVPSTEPKPPTTNKIISPNRSLSPETRRMNSIHLTRKEARSPSTLNGGPDSMILIKRSYNFAGKVHTEQKLVPRNSAEAKLFLASQPEPKTSPETVEPTGPFTKPKRKPKLARRSIFEPIPPEGLPQRTDLHFGVRKDGDLTLVGVAGKDAKKLNTVEKSAMDWAGFVDKEGIADELDAAGKSKGAYKARQEFLARVEQNREESLRGGQRV